MLLSVMQHSVTEVQANCLTHLSVFERLTYKLYDTAVYCDPSWIDSNVRTGKDRAMVVPRTDTDVFARLGMDIERV